MVDSGFVERATRSTASGHPCQTRQRPRQTIASNSPGRPPRKTDHFSQPAYAKPGAIQLKSPCIDRIHSDACRHRQANINPHIADCLGTPIGGSPGELQARENPPGPILDPRDHGSVGSSEKLPVGRRFAMSSAMSCLQPGKTRSLIVAGSQTYGWLGT